MPRRFLFGPILLVAPILAGCNGNPPDIAPRTTRTVSAREVVALATDRDGRTIAVRSPGAIRLLDWPTLRESAQVPLDLTTHGGVAFAPDGQTLAADRASTGPVVWDVTNHRIRDDVAASTRPPAMSCYSVAYGIGIAYSPDGQQVAWGGSDGGEGGFIKRFDLGTRQTSTLTDAYTAPVTALAWSPDGGTIAGGDLGGAVDLWDPATGRKRRTIAAGRAFLGSIAFSADGRLLATPSADRTAKVWDVATGQQLARLQWHLKVILALAFSPDGKTLATADAGGTILLWDWATQRRVARLTGAERQVWAVAFTPDGRSLIAGGDDGKLRVYDVPSLQP